MDSRELQRKTQGSDWQSDATIARPRYPKRDRPLLLANTPPRDTCMRKTFSRHITTSVLLTLPVMSAFLWALVSIFLSFSFTPLPRPQASANRPALLSASGQDSTPTEKLARMHRASDPRDSRDCKRALGRRTSASYLPSQRPAGDHPRG